MSIVKSRFIFKFAFVNRDEIIDNCEYINNFKITDVHPTYLGDDKFFKYLNDANKWYYSVFDKLDINNLYTHKDLKSISNIMRLFIKEWYFDREDADVYCNSFIDPPLYSTDNNNNIIEFIINANEVKLLSSGSILNAFQVSRKINEKLKCLKNITNINNGLITNIIRHNKLGYRINKVMDIIDKRLKLDDESLISIDFNATAKNTIKRLEIEKSKLINEFKNRKEDVMSDEIELVDENNDRSRLGIKFKVNLFYHNSNELTNLTRRLPKIAFINDLRSAYIPERYKDNLDEFIEKYMDILGNYLEVEFLGVQLSKNSILNFNESVEDNKYIMVVELNSWSTTDKHEILVNKEKLTSCLIESSNKLL